MQSFINTVLPLYLVAGGMTLFYLTAVKEGGRMVDKLVISVLFPLVPLYLAMVLLREAMLGLFEWFEFDDPEWDEEDEDHVPVPGAPYNSPLPRKQDERKKERTESF